MKNLLFGVRGRLTRASFWLVALGIVVVELLLFAALGGEAAMSGDPQAALAAMRPVAGAVLLVFGLLATWVSLSVAIKRFHDRDKSGWWLLILLVPVVGGLWYLIECGFLRGTEGSNRYGNDPLARY
jgi:uncharacterized membrane protein YhaH (DUF805 family)